MGADPRFADENAITELVIGAAIAIHKELGPGLLESVYHECMVIELERQGLPFQTELEVPIEYRGKRLRGVHRLDLLVAGKVVVELKAVETLAAVHKAQLITYLRLTRTRVGLLINFNSAMLRDGIQRIVL